MMWSGFYRRLTTHLCLLDNYWMHFHEDPFEYRNGVKIVRGTAVEWPPDANYETKLEAMRDSRIVFDRLRLAFFVPDRVRAKTMADAIYELGMGEVESIPFRNVADFLICTFLEMDSREPTWPLHIQDNAIRVYLRTISTKP